MIDFTGFSLASYLLMVTSNSAAFRLFKKKKTNLRSNKIHFIKFPALRVKMKRQWWCFLSYFFLEFPPIFHQIVHHTWNQKLISRTWSKLEALKPEVISQNVPCCIKTLEFVGVGVLIAAAITMLENSKGTWKFPTWHRYCLLIKKM